MINGFRWDTTAAARTIDRRLMLERANRDARRLPTKPNQGTREHLKRLLGEYAELRAYHRANPPREWSTVRGMADFEAITREGYVRSMRQAIMTEIRRQKLFRDGEAPAYQIGAKVWFPATFGYSVVVFGEYRDGEGWTYIYSHPFEAGAVLAGADQ